MKKYYTSLFFLSHMVFFLCGAGSLLGQETAQATLPTTTLVIGNQKIVAEIADDDIERSKGLMQRTGLAENAGMLFVMPQIGPAAFWMRNTKIPLSIAFLDPQGTIVEIHEMQPYDETQTRSVFPRIAYALEMTQGWFTKQNIWPGERVSGLPPPPQ